METFGKFCWILIILIISAIIGGFVFMTLWKWFVVTTFHIQAISLPQSIGLVLLIGYLKSNTKNDDKKNDLDGTLDDLGKSFLNLIGYVILTLIIGWIIFQFV